MLNSPTYNIDDIELGIQIGHGPKADIFMAKCGLDEVVVKRFLDPRSSAAKREIETIRRVRHKYIVEFYHVQQDMAVMEYLEGGNLADTIVNNGLRTWQAKTQIARDISLGLAYLHHLGIIHCDIKSSNILLTRHKEARICDFGHARSAGETGEGATLQWMAPELLQDPPLYTSQSDVYALGMVMWEMASMSAKPYQKYTPEGVMHCILEGILEEIPEDTPNAYAACIQACWNQTPEMRPTAMDVLSDAEGFPEGHDASRLFPQAYDAPRLLPQRYDASKLRSTMARSEKPHYLKALRKYFDAKDGGTPSFLDVLRGGLHSDDKIMDWFHTTTIGAHFAADMFEIGGIYYSGRGAQQDYGEALEWYLAASEVGKATAMLKISQMYQYGRGVEQDDQEAASWYQKAEEVIAGLDETNNRVVHHEAAVTEHHTRTMEWFSSPTGSGAAAAELAIGNMYCFGQDIEQDVNRALEWYLKASDHGEVEAMYSIGKLYHSGHGVARDLSKALQWYIKAADGGCTAAMLHIGNIYRDGESNTRVLHRGMSKLHIR
ncbi:hypothetical protein BGZ68_010274 [Mortierella alpina]|nr:hypothetical protein BGZ68_010274 [Mortierella alpina]